jgi:hypothetical protein
LAQDPAGLTPVKGRRSGRVRALARDGRGDNPTDCSQSGRCVEHPSPVADPADGIEQMGHRVAQRDGTDEQPDSQTAVRARPGGHDPHADRVDPDQRQTREEAQGQREG